MQLSLGQVPIYFTHGKWHFIEAIKNDISLYFEKKMVRIRIQFGEAIFHK